MSNPQGLFPFWEPDSFTQVTGQVLDCGFASPQISFCLDRGLGNESLGCASGSGAPTAFSGIVQLHLNIILALSQDFLFRM